MPYGGMEKEEKGRKRTFIKPLIVLQILGWIIYILYSTFILTRTYEMFYLCYFTDEETESLRGWLDSSKARHQLVRNQKRDSQPNLISTPDRELGPPSLAV